MTWPKWILHMQWTYFTLKEIKSLETPNLVREVLLSTPSFWPRGRHLDCVGQESDLPSALIPLLSSKIVSYTNIMEKIVEGKNCSMLCRNIIQAHPSSPNCFCTSASCSVLQTNPMGLLLSDVLLASLSACGTMIKWTGLCGCSFSLFFFLKHFFFSPW